MCFISKSQKVIIDMRIQINHITENIEFYFIHAYFIIYISTDKLKILTFLLFKNTSMIELNVKKTYTTFLDCDTSNNNSIFFFSFNNKNIQTRICSNATCNNRLHVDFLKIIKKKWN